jgi:hypothetical protein
MPDAPSTGSRPARTRPARGAGRESDFFSEHVLQDRLAQAQVGHEPLQFRILVLELLQPTNFRDAHRPEILPPLERLLRHAELAADLRDRLARRLLRQGVGDLLFRETLLLHANLQAGWRPKCPRYLAASLAQESGEDQGLILQPSQQFIREFIAWQASSVG